MALAPHAERALTQFKQNALILYGAGHFTEDDWVCLDKMIHGSYVFTNGPPKVPEQLVSDSKDAPGKHRETSHTFSSNTRVPKRDPDVGENNHSIVSRNGDLSATEESALSTSESPMLSTSSSNVSSTEVPNSDSQRSASTTSVSPWTEPGNSYLVHSNQLPENNDLSCSCTEKETVPLSNHDGDTNGNIRSWASDVKSESHTQEQSAAGLSGEQNFQQEHAEPTEIQNNSRSFQLNPYSAEFDPEKSSLLTFGTESELMAASPSPTLSQFKPNPTAQEFTFGKSLIEPVSAVARGPSLASPKSMLFRPNPEAANFELKNPAVIDSSIDAAPKSQLASPESVRSELKSNATETASNNDKSARSALISRPESTLFSRPSSTAGSVSTIHTVSHLPKRDTYTLPLVAGKIYIAAAEQRKTSKIVLEIGCGDSVEILKNVSGQMYFAKSLQTKLLGQVNAMIFLQQESESSDKSQNGTMVVQDDHKRRASKPAKKATSLRQDMEVFATSEHTDIKQQLRETIMAKERLEMEIAARDKKAADELAIEKIRVDNLTTAKLAAEKLAARKLVEEKANMESAAAEEFAAKQLADDERALEENIAEEKRLVEKLARSRQLRSIHDGKKSPLSQSNHTMSKWGTIEGIDVIEATNAAEWELDSVSDANTVAPSSSRASVDMSAPDTDAWNQSHEEDKSEQGWNEVSVRTKQQSSNLYQVKQRWQPASSNSLSRFSPVVSRPGAVSSFSTPSRFSVISDDPRQVEMSIQEVRREVREEIRKELTQQIEEVRKGRPALRKTLLRSRLRRVPKETLATLGAMVPKQKTCWFWHVEGDCRFTDEECMHRHYIVPGEPVEYDLIRGKPRWGAADDYEGPDSSQDPELYPEIGMKNFTCLWWARDGKCTFSDDQCKCSHKMMPAGVYKGNAFYHRAKSDLSSSWRKGGRASEDSRSETDRTVSHSELGGMDGTWTPATELSSPAWETASTNNLVSMEEPPW